MTYKQTETAEPDGNQQKIPSGSDQNNDIENLDKDLATVETEVLEEKPVINKADDETLVLNSSPSTVETEVLEEKPVINKADDENLVVTSSLSTVETEVLEEKPVINKADNENLVLTSSSTTVMTEVLEEKRVINKVGDENLVLSSSSSTVETEVLEDKAVINKADDENLVLTSLSPKDIEKEATFKSRELVVLIEKMKCVPSQGVASENDNESNNTSNNSSTLEEKPASTPIKEIPVEKDRTKRRKKLISHDIILQSKKIHPKEKNKSTPRIYFCQICGLKFTCFRRFWNHRKLAHSGHAFCCMLCPERFKNYSTLLGHTRAVHKLTADFSDKKGDPLFYCEACGLGFRNIYKKAIHVRTNHAGGYISCSLCDHSSSSVNKLRLHMSVHKEIKKSFYFCKICHQTLYFLPVFVNHLRSHSNITASKVYKCKQCCFLEIKSFPEYVKHMEGHLFKNPKYFCSFCDKYFRSNSKLEWHMRLHKEYIKSSKTNNKNMHDCYYCGKSLSKNRMKTHLKRHVKFNSAIKKKPITCRICLKAVAPIVYKFHLAKHLAQAKIKNTGKTGNKKDLKPDNEKRTVDINSTKNQNNTDKDNVPKSDQNLISKSEKLEQPPAVNVQKDQTPYKQSKKQSRFDQPPWKQFSGGKFRMEGPPGVDLGGMPSVGPFIQNRPNFRGPMNNPPFRGNRPMMMNPMNNAPPPFHGNDPMNNPRPPFHGNDPMMMNPMNNPRPPFHANDPMMMNPMNNPRPPFHGNDPMMMNPMNNPRPPFHGNDPRMINPMNNPRPPFRGNDPMMINPMNNPRPPFRGNDPMMMNPMNNPRPPFHGNDPMMMNPMNNPRPPFHGNDPMMINPMNNPPPPFRGNDSVNMPGYPQQNFGMFPPPQPMMNYDNEYGNQFQPMQPDTQDPNQLGYGDGYQQFTHDMSQWSGSHMAQSTGFTKEPFNFRNDTICGGCQKIFGTSKVLLVHELFCFKLVDKLSKQKMHDCPVCLQKFASLPTVKQHLFQSHAQIFKEFNLFNQKAGKNECKTCKQVFNNKEELAAHEMTHEFLASLKSDLEKVDVSSTLLGKSTKPVRKSRFDQVTPIPKPSCSATTQEPSNQKVQETLKITQKVAPEGLQLEDINSPSYKMKLEQQKKKLKINILYYQKQKLEHEKQSGSREKLKATDYELKKIQKKLLETQKSSDTIDLTGSKQDTLRRSRSRSPRRQTVNLIGPKQDTLRRSRNDGRRSRSLSGERRRFADRSQSPRSGQNRRTPEKTTRWSSRDALDKRQRSSPMTEERHGRKLILRPGEEQNAYKCRKCATLFSNYRDFITHSDMHESDSDEDGRRPRSLSRERRHFADRSQSPRSGQNRRTPEKTTRWSSKDTLDKRQRSSPITEERHGRKLNLRPGDSDEDGRRSRSLSGERRRFADRSRSPRSGQNRRTPEKTTRWISRDTLDKRQRSSPMAEERHGRKLNLRPGDRHESDSDEDGRRSRSLSRERRRFADRSQSPRSGQNRRTPEKATSWSSRDTLDKRQRSSPMTEERHGRKLNIRPGEEQNAYKCQKCATLFSNYRDFITHSDMHEIYDDEENYLSLLDPHPSTSEDRNVSEPSGSSSYVNRKEDYRSKYSRTQPDEESRFRSSSSSSQAHGSIQKKREYFPPRDARAKCNICYEEFSNPKDLGYHVCPGPF